MNHSIHNKFHSTSEIRHGNVRRFSPTNQPPTQMIETFFTQQPIHESIKPLQYLRQRQAAREQGPALHCSAPKEKTAMSKAPPHHYPAKAEEHQTERHYESRNQRSNAGPASTRSCWAAPTAQPYYISAQATSLLPISHAETLSEVRRVTRSLIGDRSPRRRRVTGSGAEVKNNNNNSWGAEALTNTFSFCSTAAAYHNVVILAFKFTQTAEQQKPI
jgi:hypothetical protein